VCEGTEWVAFFPLEPATPGHTLVIPRKHFRDLWRVEPKIANELMCAVQLVGRAICSALSAEGMNLITSAGAAAEQTIYHVHLHLVPRWEQDGFERIWPVESRVSRRQERHAAARVRAACAP
jgi:histidine triad (HIT) family protein